MGRRGGRIPMLPLVAVAMAVLVLFCSSAWAGGGGGGGGGYEGTEVGWVAASTGEEFELDSEVSRRVLATSSYISYQALKRDTVPCSRRGASYYNCRPGAQANPYSRGCSAITRCRS